MLEKRISSDGLKWKVCVLPKQQGLLFLFYTKHDVPYVFDMAD